MKALVSLSNLSVNSADHAAWDNLLVARLTKNFSPAIWSLELVLITAKQDLKLVSDG